MRVNTLKSILSVSLVMLSASMGFSADKASKKSVLKKVANLTGTQYCKDETQLKNLPQIAHLDERNQIDRIVISKKGRKLYLLSQGSVYKSYDVAFGFGFYEGNKVSMGDGRTPEGIYQVELKNENSAYYRALRVSYPNQDDKKFAAAAGVQPGGDIMIHGFPSTKDKAVQHYALTQTHPMINWTQGCIAVTDKEIEEIFSIVAVSTTIEICPR